MAAIAIINDPLFAFNTNDENVLEVITASRCGDFFFSLPPMFV